MKAHRVIATVCHLILVMTKSVLSRGKFEVHLSQINFTRWSGPVSCCPSASSSPLACSRSCSVYTRVCLTVYDRTFTSERCHFGNHTVQLSPNPAGREPLPRVDRDFTFHILPRWNEYFTLVIDVFGGAPKQLLKKDTRLVRHIESKSIKPSKDWYTFMREKSSATLQYSYRFQCDANYYGKDCGQRCEPRNGTHGHYDCSSTGERVCHPGWSGSFCTVAKCGGECHMRCEGVSCRCEDGWEGPQCDRCKKADKCVNGKCKVDSRGNKFPGTCECIPGWGGQNCEKDLHYCANHRGVCKNGGTCFNQEDPENGAQQFRCRCKDGFTGPTCETEIAKSCLVNRCKNGRCMSDSETKRYMCVCSSNYFGSRCELNITECTTKYCSMPGTHCMWDIHMDTRGRPRCVCPEGKRCGGKMDYCASRPCKNGGTCVALENGYRCSCPAGLSGNRCQFNLSACSLTCRNGGRCRHTATRLFCDCPVGFTGSTCECPPCYNGDCVRAPGPEVGGALEYRCICKRGFYGLACNRSMPTLSAWPTGPPDLQNTPTPTPTLLILVVIICLLMLTALAIVVFCCRRAYYSRRRASQANDCMKNNRPKTIQNDLHAPMSFRPDSPMPSATVHPQQIKKPLDDNSSLGLPSPKVHNIADQSVNLLPPPPPPPPPPPSTAVATPTTVALGGGCGGGGGNNSMAVGLPREAMVWPMSHPRPGIKDTAVFLSTPERRRQGINWFGGSAPTGHATQV